MDDAHPLKHAIGVDERENDGLYLKSDCDAQLFIHLTFSQVVKVQSLVVQCADDVREMAPTKAAVSFCLLVQVRVAGWTQAA